MNIIDEIDEQIQELIDKKAEIQNACSHPQSVRELQTVCVTDEYGADETYYEVFTCLLCKKTWSEGLG